HLYKCGNQPDHASRPSARVPDLTTDENPPTRCGAPPGARHRKDLGPNGLFLADKSRIGGVRRPIGECCDCQMGRVCWARWDLYLRDAIATRRLKRRRRPPGAWVLAW